MRKITRKIFNFLLHGRPKPLYANISYLTPKGCLKGKKVVITGGGRGLGYAMASKFISEGADVLIAGRNMKTLEESALRLKCKFLRLDVSCTSEFKMFIDNAESILGRIDVLVNNAGISLHEKSFFDVTPETFDKQVDTNLKGSFFLSQSYISYLKKNNICGEVLFISSETGDTMDFRPYGLTKAAVNSMVQGLAYLFAKDGIRINAISPGITASDMTGIDKNGDLSYPRNMLGRIYLPEEVAETACFIISDASNCISGQIITLNNGKSINARWK